MNTTAPTPTRVFRPWNTDSTGIVIKENPAAVTIAYEHDPSREYTIGRRELGVIGRFVTRGKQ